MRGSMAAATVVVQPPPLSPIIAIRLYPSVLACAASKQNQADEHLFAIRDARDEPKQRKDGEANKENTERLQRT